MTAHMNIRRIIKLKTINAGCQIKTNAPQNGAFLPLLLNLAGDESDGWHPLVEDFIVLGKKLEKLGFVYHKGEVIVIEPTEAGR
jgi:hypothetical protein